MTLLNEEIETRLIKVYLKKTVDSVKGHEQQTKKWPGAVAHTYNPSTLGGRGG